MAHMYRSLSKVRLFRTTYFIAPGRFAVAAFFCFILMLGAGAARSDMTIPLIYVVGSGNDVLDNYLLDQVRQLVGQEVAVVPVNESKPALNPGIPIVTIGRRAFTTTLGRYPQSPILATPYFPNRAGLPYWPRQRAFTCTANCCRSCRGTIWKRRCLL